MMRVCPRVSQASMCRQHRYQLLTLTRPWRLEIGWSRRPRLAKVRVRGCQRGKVIGVCGCRGHRQLRLVVRG